VNFLLTYNLDLYGCNFLFLDCLPKKKKKRKEKPLAMPCASSMHTPIPYKDIPFV
jgi:hypothetical protein